MLWHFCLPVLGLPLSTPKRKSMIRILRYVSASACVFGHCPISHFSIVGTVFIRSKASFGYWPFRCKDSLIIGFTFDHAFYGRARIIRTNGRGGIIGIPFGGNRVECTSTTLIIELTSSGARKWERKGTAFFFAFERGKSSFLTRVIC